MNRQKICDWLMAELIEEEALNEGFAEALSNDLNIVFEIGLGPMALADLITRAERVFKIILDEEKVAEMRTVGGFIETIESSIRSNA